MQLITSHELARKLGVSVQTIGNHCRKLGIRRIGRDYVLTPDDAKSVEWSISTSQVGRPPKA